MKTIDLSDSFEAVLSEALALPDGDHRPISDESMAKALRGLFAAAHGRSVRTSIGLIPVAPAIVPSLKTAPLSLRSRAELLVLADKVCEFNRKVSKNGSGTICCN